MHNNLSFAIIPVLLKSEHRFPSKYRTLTDSNPTSAIPDEPIPDGSTKLNRSEEAAAA